MIELLRGLWPEPPTGPDTNVTIWELPGKESLHVPLEQLLGATDEDVAELLGMMDGHNVYYGHGLRCDGLGPTERGTKNDVTWLPGFVLDIDLFNPDRPEAHKAEGQRLPQSIDHVDTILAAGPEPSGAVATGNGLHVYWRFDAPRRLNNSPERKAMARAYERFQRPYITCAKENGWHLDLTASIDRVWRLPGFRNEK